MNLSLLSTTKLPNSEIQKENKVLKEKELQEFPRLKKRSKDDPMNLLPAVMRHLDACFSARGLPYISGQRALLQSGVIAILQGSPGVVTALPFQPGLGKSTIIRATLETLAKEFAEETSIAKRIGGCVIVVEKSSEGLELEHLCNQYRKAGRIAHLVVSPNDTILANGGCFNETAVTRNQCPGRKCKDAKMCGILQSQEHMNETPILVMLQARYDRYMEDMSPLCYWYNKEGNTSKRTLLLVDELPQLIDDTTLSLSDIIDLEHNLIQWKPSKYAESRKFKSYILSAVSYDLKYPFMKLLTSLNYQSLLFGFFESTDFEDFDKEKLLDFRDKLVMYMNTTNHPIFNKLDMLINNQNSYFNIDQDITLGFPHIREIHGKNQPATFIFSGTTGLSPELSKNSNIVCLPDQPLHTFERLTLHLQRGDQFRSGKTSFGNPKNLVPAVAWLKDILRTVVADHQKVLVATYKMYSLDVWNELSEFHDHLVPFVSSSDSEPDMLPYFGGMNGSNLYSESTCVICFGWNRFQGFDYINRALALDFDGTCRKEIQNIMYPDAYTLAQLPCILAMQDITLARDLVQLIFRSDLRNHSHEAPIDVYLLQPPNAVVDYLLVHFPGCNVREIKELPECCIFASAENQTYKGAPTSASILLQYLEKKQPLKSFTPSQIRDETGLSKNQFKEAKRNPAVRTYFQQYIEKSGSGKNTVYCKKAS